MCTNRVSGNLPPNYSQFSNSQGLEEKNNISNNFFIVGSKQYDVNEFRSNVVTQMLNINRNRNIMDSYISFGNCYGSLRFADCIAEITRQSGFTCDSDGSNYKYDGNNPAESIKILVQIESLLMTDMQIINLCYIMAFLEMVGDDEFNRIITQQIMPQHNGVFNLSKEIVDALPCPKCKHFDFSLLSSADTVTSAFTADIKIGDYVSIYSIIDRREYHLMCVDYNSVDYNQFFYQPLFLGYKGKTTPSAMRDIYFDLLNNAK